MKNDFSSLHAVVKNASDLRFQPVFACRYAGYRFTMQSPRICIQRGCSERGSSTAWSYWPHLLRKQLRVDEQTDKTSDKAGKKPDRVTRTLMGLKSAKIYRWWYCLLNSSFCSAPWWYWGQPVNDIARTAQELFGHFYRCCNLIPSSAIGVHSKLSLPHK